MKNKKELKLYGLNPDKGSLSETMRELPMECQSCCHCGFVPSARKDLYYCWSCEGLVEDVIDWCRENKRYEPAPKKLDHFFALNTCFWNVNTLIEKLSACISKAADKKIVDLESFLSVVSELKESQNKKKQVKTHE